ncbi:hypothetical protein SAMN05443287_102566 [Micromonospora phaseoli]|uniref:Uncharacterized protein n=1 Tax=Micromonospora phaseoli TaxID=1144548 RepID=A0A1H6VHY4_9ACTN|nr:hypothetical protein [Micromonospora phaseoli]PZV93681.1 hypothetical protein CLV64_109140 [Micromonospora phaseoli]GIJ79161.1 hypothetical protein Xph01_35930 [Micromonospora phaseoli]SEJ00330.1 hypothetical protein SAMN05443287_102566 [Micromonospora phaseoli]
MSDSHPPYGGQQPDPNAPWGTPPGSPVGPPRPPGSPIGQPSGPGYPSPYGAPVPPPLPPYAVAPVKSANKGLWLGLGIGAAVMAVLIACGGTIGYFVLAGDDETTPLAGGESAAPATSAAPSIAPPADVQPDNNNALTARNSSDMSAVCEGSPILNAAPYTAAKGAKVYTFANSPDRPESWLSKSVGFDKPYYAKTADWASVSIVGCLTFEQGSEGEPRKCNYEDRDDKKITVDYLSSRYTLTFYAARTGEKIGEGGRVNAPAVRCPSFISYNKETMRAYAQPDSGAIELALEKFTS